MSCSSGSSPGIAAPWHLVETPSAASRSVSVQIDGPKLCTSGRKMSEFLTKPKISYQSDRIEVALFVSQPTGPQTCQGRLGDQDVIHIDLDQAVGQRRVVDGNAP